jgi:hypothetical protein
MAPASRVRGDDLKALLARRMEDARAKVLQSDGRIDASEIDEVERMARLVALEKDMQPPARQRPTLVAGLLVGTLMAVSILMFARLTETDVEVAAVASELSFGLQAPQNVSEGISADELLVTCACDIRVPAGPGHPARVVAASERGNAVVGLTAAVSGERRGSLTVAPIALPADSLVRLRHRGTPGRYLLSIEAAQLTLRVNAYGPIQLAVPGEAPATVDFVVPRAMLATPAGRSLTVDIATSDKGDLGLARQILVNRLVFMRMDEASGQEQVVRRVSTIAGGTLYWEALNGSERPLRPAEQIELDGVRGEVVALDLKESDIALRFHGTVTGVTAGWGSNRRSLMPTWLEWLRARHGLSLLWGSTIYIVGLLMGALRWLRVAL